MTSGPHENGHSRELRFECPTCLGWTITRPLKRDTTIRIVTAIVRPIEFFDPENGGILDTVAFLNQRRKTGGWDHEVGIPKGCEPEESNQDSGSLRWTNEESGVVGHESRHAEASRIRRITDGVRVIEAIA